MKKLNWHEIPWDHCNHEVANLQEELVMALRNGSHKQVKEVQRKVDVGEYPTVTPHMSSKRNLQKVTNPFLARLRLGELLEPCAVRVARTVLRGGKFREESTYPNWVNECILRSLAL
jgi:hypothetical protein